MPECIICGSYSKFQNGYCVTCYHKKNNTPNEDSGLNDQQLAYRYNIIKGKIAETLIQELFLSLDYNVFRYGMENTIPGVMNFLKGVRSDVAENIKRMPDFVVHHPKTNQVYFIEVKFRANGIFSLSNLPENYPYKDAHIILVSKKHIKCITVKELLAGKEITPESKNYLGNREEFQLNKNIIIDFCSFAIKFFENI